MPYRNLSCSYDTIDILYRIENITHVIPDAWKCSGCNSVFGNFEDMTKHVELVQAGKERRNGRK